MIRQNRIKIVISSIITLLPMLFALIFWNSIPDTLTTHWGLDGQADGWMSKNIAVFITPLIFLAAHLFCILATMLDSRNKKQSPKVFNIIIWIFPVFSNFMCAAVFLSSVGHIFDAAWITTVLMALMFIIIGNYLPKCKQNATIGIKVKWTLESESNWNATHRLGGRLWVIGGILMLFSSLLPLSCLIWVILFEIVLMVAIPVIYSYRFYKQELKSGTFVKSETPSIGKRTKLIIYLILIAVLIGSAVLMFTGNIKTEFNNESFTVKANYWSDLSVKYDVVESVELREDIDFGLRTYGLGSARLLAGSFKNDLFDDYTLYAYTRAKTCVVINTSKFGILVIAGKDDAETLEIYNKISERI